MTAPKRLADLLTLPLRTDECGHLIQWSSSAPLSLERLMFGRPDITVGIVRAINCHDDLLAALKMLVEDIETSCERWGDSSLGPATVPLEPADLPISSETWRAVAAAIAKAEAGIDPEAPPHLETPVAVQIEQGRARQHLADAGHVNRALQRKP